MYSKKVLSKGCSKWLSVAIYNYYIYIYMHIVMMLISISIYIYIVISIFIYVTHIYIYLCVYEWISSIVTYPFIIHPSESSPRFFSFLWFLLFKLPRQVFKASSYPTLLLESHSPTIEFCSAYHIPPLLLKPQKDAAKKNTAIMWTLMASSSAY